MPDETHIPRHARLSQFNLLRGQCLLGPKLRDVRMLETSIATYGLLSPLIVLERSSGFAVVDGRKRMIAIKRLAFEGRLPRSLSRLPYLLASDVSGTQPSASILVANPTLFDAVQSEFKSGHSVEAIADGFQISGQCVRDLLSLSRLSPIVRTAFFDRMISFQQACNYATIPSPFRQDICLMRLGPGATPRQIVQEYQRTL